VEQVDFISAAGYLDGGDARERLGLEGGPELVISNLAVMDFDPVSKRMRLRSVHPGVDVEQVREATGFELLMPEGTIPVTDPPSREQVRLIREIIDPDGMRKHGFRPLDAGRPRA
jgi:glutaconate CoA-transferase subunit B